VITMDFDVLRLCNLASAAATELAGCREKMEAAIGHAGDAENVAAYATLHRQAQSHRLTAGRLLLAARTESDVERWERMLDAFDMDHGRALDCVCFFLAARDSIRLPDRLVEPTPTETGGAA